MKKIKYTSTQNDMGVSKTQTSKTQTPDPKNSDPRVSRKLRPKKLRPSGVSKTQTQKNSDPRVSRKLRPEKYNKFTPRDEPTCLLFVDTVASLPRKEKQLIVLDTCNVHENYLPRKEKKKLAV